SRKTGGARPFRHRDAVGQAAHGYEEKRQHLNDQPPLPRTSAARPAVQHAMELCQADTERKAAEKTRFMGGRKTAKEGTVPYLLPPYRPDGRSASFIRKAESTH